MKVVAALVALFLVGMWLGEGNELSLVMRAVHLRVSPGASVVVPLVLIALAGAAGFLVVRKSARWRRILAAVVAMVALVGGMVAGEVSETRAFNECVTAGETVRVSLADFAAREGRFPATVGELEGSAPCRRILRGTVLDYRPVGTGYHLEFGDWLVTHAATESRPFFGTK